MKICLISNLYPPIQRGGAEQVAATMAQALKQLGHEVLVISTKPDRGLTTELIEGIKIYRFKPFNIFYYLNDHKHFAPIRLLWHIIDQFNYPATRLIKKLLTLEKPNLVITHNLKGINLATPLVLKSLNLKHFHVLHDIQSAIPSGLIFKGQENSFLATGFLTNWYQRINRHFLDQVDIVLSPSNWLLNFYGQLGFFQKARDVILFNPINETPISTAKTTKTNAFLFLGQLEKHKGLDWLINFWQKNQITSPLFIAGAGSLKFKNLPDNIHLLGYLKEDSLKEIFTKVDFTIVPSICYENSPTVIPISYANATPVIAVDHGGTPELVGYNNTGFTYRAKDQAELLDLINKALSLSQADYTEMSALSLQKSKIFSLAQYKNRLASLLADSQNIANLNHPKI